MVTLKQIRASNATLKASKTPLTAVFVGATSGIGKGTLLQFFKTVPLPKVYIIGRSKIASKELLNELSLLNPRGTFRFLESQISLMKNVDLVCEEIKSREEKIDVLFMSPGFLDLGGRNETPEGIDLAQALRYYTRLRFTHNLLPLLSLSSSPRVISILAGALSSPLDFSDLEMRKAYNSFTAAGNGATQTTLAFEELAKTNSKIIFIHKYPGFVATDGIPNMLETARGFWSSFAKVARWTLVPVLRLFSMSLGVAGERGVFIATSGRYPPKEAKMYGELPEGVDFAKASVVMEGERNGVYLLDAKDESQPSPTLLQTYREEGKGEIVWESTMGVWERALARA